MHGSLPPVKDGAYILSDMIRHVQWLNYEGNNSAQRRIDGENPRHCRQVDKRGRNFEPRREKISAFSGIQYPA